MATVRHFWHGFSHKGYNIYVPSVYSPPLFITVYQIFGRRCTKSAPIFVDVPYWPPYSTDKFISCVVTVPSQWFFHFGEEITIAWTHIGWLLWMFQNLPLPAAQEVRVSSSGVTPCIVMKNDEVQHKYVSSFTPESMRLQFLRQSERPLWGTRTTQDMNLSML